MRIFSVGVFDRRLLRVVRLEVLQEKAAKGQEERKRWERKGDESNIRNNFFFTTHICQNRRWRTFFLQSTRNELILANLIQRI